MNIKDIVSNNKQVTFTHYFDGDLWYRTECGFSFPVPVSDAGTATFLAEDRAMLFMRYIRKHIQTLANNRAAEVPFDDRHYDEMFELALTDDENVNINVGK